METDPRRLGQCFLRKSNFNTMTHCISPWAIRVTRFQRMHLAILAVFTSSLITGCARWGGQILEDNHVAFNTSVSDAMDRQMLLNIVRMSKDKPVQWMIVSAINVQATVGAEANGLTTIPSSGLVEGAAGVGVNLNYTPNITFLPRQGEQLAREMMSPIPVSTIESMVSASWPISWVLFLTADQVQTVRSFDITRRNGFVTHSKQFGRLMQLFNELETKQLVSLSEVPTQITWNPNPIPKDSIDIADIMRSKTDKSGFIARPDGSYDYKSVESVAVLTLHPTIEKTPDGEEFLNMLGLSISENNYRMLSSVDIWPGKTFSIRTRSFTAVMRLLSMGVDSVVNAPDPSVFMNTAEELFAKIADAPDGSNLTENVDAIFRVHCTSVRPKDSLISVLYRDQWYWIDEADFTSRCLFSMVRDMYDLQVKNEEGNAPVLTIPVGSGR